MRDNKIIINYYHNANVNLKQKKYMLLETVDGTNITFINSLKNLTMTHFYHPLKYKILLVFYGRQYWSFVLFIEFLGIMISVLQNSKIKPLKGILKGFKENIQKRTGSLIKDIIYHGYNLKVYFLIIFNLIIYKYHVIT